MRLDNTIAITFTGPEHRHLDSEFHNLYRPYFHTTISYTTEDLKTTSFYKENMQMFKYKKYFGYFLWKPFIILQTLIEYPNFNVLYCDSNLRFKDFDRVSLAFREGMTRHGAFFVKHEHFLNRSWTKRDCFILMEADNERYYNAHQVWTPLMGFNSSYDTMMLLSEYMHYCKDPSIVTEEPNKFGKNLPEFNEHRWEQSVMSILVEKYGYKGISDTVLMNWVYKVYPQDIMTMKEEINANPLAKSI